MAGILVFLLSVSLATTNGGKVTGSVSDGRRSDDSNANVAVAAVGENLEIPDDCKGIGICEDIPNYPEDIVKSLIEDLEKSNISVFNKDALNVPTVSRRLESGDDTELCRSVEKIYAPRAARATDGQWFYILNERERPRQTFRLEICHTDNSPCSSAIYIQSSYEARCVQKYIIRQMIGLDSEKKILKLNIQVPSCCSCVMKHV
ncbi:protein spaetzle-like isoform X2 [Vanessa atalanta]|uniref:protein spaetzle-like isoform X2 n=1 Tax=Vanessa atalanta TaxID=42275 RepID=UPI001FCD45E7|nr:protein spaetzle-like isoform X2 [Vanessa atalanta]